MRSSVGIRVLLSLGVSCLAVVLAFAGVPGAHAEVSVCYTDPVVVLSNGNTLDLSDTIGDNYLDVQQIVYTLHAPAGTSVVSVAYTSGPIGPKESLRFYADQAAGQYATTSVVTTGSSSVNVTADGSLVALTGLDNASANGVSGERIRLTLSS